MKIGIISDSHGNSQRLRSAISLMVHRQVKVIVHCGDVGSLDCVSVLGSAPATVYMVAGNVDRNISQLEITARNCNIHFAWEVATVPIENDQYLAATHGDDEGVLGGLVLGQQFPYICHGHSHRLRDDRVGCARVINPGALHRSGGRPTVAVLDTVADHLDILDVPASEPPKASQHKAQITLEL
jgi:putative phosphoesterase